jgi:hypothetical protein
VTPEMLIQAAVLGPALGAVVWLALVRLPRTRRVAAGAVALAAHAAAWAVFWTAFRGEPAAWRGLEPDLLGASVVVAAELGILVALVRADPLHGGGAPAAVLGLAASASAIAVAAYATSVTLVALFVPIPTLAAGVASLAGPGRADLRGLAGLAGADVVALVGLSVLLDRAGTTILGPSTGLAPGLLLAAAAIKVGAVPWVGTARLATSGGPGSILASGLRGQGIALAALAGLELARGQEMAPLAVAAAAAAALGGVAAALARGRPSAVAAAAGAGASVPFLALGLGGAVGARAFLVLFPPLLLAAAAADVSLGERGPARPSPPGRARRVAGAAALGVAVGSLAGLPPGGGFPGTWLTLSLGAIRGEADVAFLAVIGATALGLAMAAVAAAPVVRAARPRTGGVVVAVVAAIGLLYAGIQPVRLGVGWWLRIEAELNLPQALAASGAPDLPAIGGLNLLLASAPALLLTGLVILLGGGLRTAGGPFVSIPVGRRRLRGPGRRWVPAPVASAARAWRRRRLGFAVALLLEAGAVAMVLRVVILAARAGFL